MKRILIVCNNEFINLLYVMNLEVYLGVNTSLVLGAAGAIEALSTKTVYDLILTVSMANKENTAKELEVYLKSYGKKTPMVIFGHSKDEIISAHITAITAKFQIQVILKMCAKILGITAKQMAQLDVGSYYPISLSTFLGFTISPCQLFIKDGENYQSVAKKNDSIEELLIELDNKVTRKLYVKSTDRLVIVNIISLAIIGKIKQSLEDLEGATIEKKINVLSTGFGFASANIFSSDVIKKHMQEIASSASIVMLNVAKETPSARSLLAILMENKDGYIFTHSMIISYTAYHMIKNVTWGGEGQVEKINFVLFFHDIFLAPIYLKHPELRGESTLVNNVNLDEIENDIIFNHAKLAAELVVTYKRSPMGADILIKQHHGMKKGKGFVRAYVEDLSPLSKVILIAEMFVEEFMIAHEENKSFSTEETILKLIALFKSPSYHKLVESLKHVPL